MALVIAGERSGVGKTTVTLALLAFLCRRHQQVVQSFKVGPDYIDPMFHQYVTGRPCRNLDPVLTSEAYIQGCFARHVQGVNHALVEGVMGLFDGATGECDWASTAHVARLLNLPVLLVLDCSRLSRSVAAIAHGYRSFDSRIQLAGVVLNRVGSDRHLQLLQDALAPMHLPILGVLRRQENIAIPDRHLGLVPTAEIAQMDALLDPLATLGDTCFNWQQLFPLLKSEFRILTSGENSPTISPAPLLLCSPAPLPPLLPCLPCSPALPPPLSPSPRLAIARDRAFSFYYQDNLDLLQHLGAELVPWSPLTDSDLPAGIQGMYFGGGFPEVFAQQLADNTHARRAVLQAIQAGMPIYAECGGLMYLCEQIVDFEQQSWSMVGAIPTTAVMSSRLTLGYRQATALQDSPLLSVGTAVWGHEFHRSCLSTMSTQPLFQTRGYQEQSAAKSEGWRLHRVHASYIHLHFGEHWQIPSRFLQHCLRFHSP